MNNIHPVFKKPMASDFEFQEELKKFPDLDVLRQNLEELIRTDKSQLSQAEIRELFFNKAIVQPFSYREYNSKQFRPNSIWRARKNINELTEDIGDPKCYSYPPSKFCFENGRANLKGKSVFYCAIEPVTPLIEIKPQAGDTVYLSEWEYNCLRNIRLACYIPLAIPKTNPWYNIAQQQFEAILKHSGEIGNQKAQHLAMVTTFVGKAFIEEQPPYCLTSWLSDEALYGYAGIDIIVYPSIQRSMVSCNLALLPTFVDECLKCRKIYKLKFTEVGKATVKYHVEKVGISDNGSFIWHDPQEEDDLNLPGAITEVIH